MKYRICVATVVFLSACAGQSPGPQAMPLGNERKVASLDNNGDAVDDSFDAALESYFGGSRDSEIKANEAVAAVIRDAVEKQQKIRQQVAQSEQRKSPEAQRIFRDLPKSDYATRDVHRKTNGCFKAELKVAPDLAQAANDQLSAYAKEDRESPDRIESTRELGVFVPGETYDAIIRLSNGNPGNHPDKVADARGFAVKILPKGTLGAAVLPQMDANELNSATKLDILAINFPTFFVNDPVKYAALNRGALESARDFKNSLVGQAEQFNSVFLASGFTALERKLTLLVNGSVIYSPLFQEYFSMVPSRLGTVGQKRAVKYSWEPVACAPEVSSNFEAEKGKQWASWTKDHSYAFPPHVPAQIKWPREPYSQSDFPADFLREHVRDRLSQGDFCFNLYFQFYRDPVSTNIEDSTDIWLSSEAERSWWVKEAVPGSLEWNTSFHNTESRSAYLNRFSQKKIAPRVLAASLSIHKFSPEEINQPISNSKTCEDLSFNPWNGNIAFHKPLGIVSRLKRKVYNASRRERHELNGISDGQIERSSSGRTE